jgi:hypothetical protein
VLFSCIILLHFVWQFIDCCVFVALVVTNPAFLSRLATSPTLTQELYVAVEWDVILLAYLQRCDETSSNPQQVHQLQKVVRKETHLCLISRFLYV